MDYLLNLLLMFIFLMLSFSWYYNGFKRAPLLTISLFTLLEVLVFVVPREVLGLRVRNDVRADGIFHVLLCLGPAALFGWRERFHILPWVSIHVKVVHQVREAARRLIPCDQPRFEVERRDLGDKFRDAQLCLLPDVRDAFLLEK